MAKKVSVTDAQRRAAQTIVERSAVTGRQVRPGVTKIAESRRSAVTGRYVTEASSTRNAAATVSESSGPRRTSASATPPRGPKTR